ncbi:hypothetical protein [Deinococcus aetherius]|uniref:hypothetical protein n=1 Tax=Deinococcus aetherius TaxID=200252 RepID=UPI002231110E|nr:hypothetical protein [Deinococcus aetherius]
MHPADEHAQKLTLALRNYDLDQVVGLLPALGEPRRIIHSVLKPVFVRAQQEEVDLLHPPHDFDTWLHSFIHLRLRGEGTVASGTVINRLTVLSRLYNLLRDEGLIASNPVRETPRPQRASESRGDMLSREEITRLHQQVTDPTLKAALLLIDRLAFDTRELRELTWEGVHLGLGTLVRGRTVARIPAEVEQALRVLQRQAGGELHAQGPVFSYTDATLRPALFRACHAANVPYSPPSRLRLAGLRDYGERLSRQDAGFLGEPAFEHAKRVAGALQVEDQPKRAQRHARAKNT